MMNRNIFISFFFTTNPGIFSKVRYCEFTGKYFCSSCHDNETYFIPSRILQSWDLAQLV